MGLKSNLYPQSHTLSNSNTLSRSCFNDPVLCMNAISYPLLQPIKPLTASVLTNHLRLNHVSHHSSKTQAVQYSAMHVPTACPCFYPIWCKSQPVTQPPFLPLNIDAAFTFYFPPSSSMHLYRSPHLQPLDWTCAPPLWPAMAQPKPALSLFPGLQISAHIHTQSPLNPFIQPTDNQSCIALCLCSHLLTYTPVSSCTGFRVLGFRVFMCAYKPDLPAPTPSMPNLSPGQQRSTRCSGPFRTCMTNHRFSPACHSSPPFWSPWWQTQTSRLRCLACRSWNC